MELALGERAANTVRTDTRQGGQTLDWSQRPERVAGKELFQLKHYSHFGWEYGVNLSEMFNLSESEMCMAVEPRATHVSESLATRLQLSASIRKATTRYKVIALL